MAMMSSGLEFEAGGDPLIGQRLGDKYTVERLIGRGGMGHVYSATAHEGGSTRDVVVKMIAPPLAQQPQALARFEREAKRLDGLRHSNIVEMYDYGREGGRAYIVMEFVDGELLSDYMGRKGRLTLAEFVPIAAQILKGVGHAHSRDLMIRDIKPANVMLCERKGRANFVKIIDFGLAKMLEGDEDITKQHFIGTSGYLSPEQIKGIDIDLRVDVYALGVLFYHMLSGRMPFEAENDTTLLYKHVHEFPTPLSEILPANHGVPEELVHLIHDCLEKDPASRPRDANEIVEKLIDCVPMAMFKLPAATESAVEQTAISALATAALNAPTGETATFLKIDQVIDEKGADRSGSALSGAKKAPSAAVLRPELVSSPSPYVGGEPAKSKTGLFVVIGVAAIALLAVGASVIFGDSKPDDPAENTDEVSVGASATAKLEAAISEAQKLLDGGDFNAAESKLDTVRGQLGDAPALAGTVDRLDKQIEAGRRLQSAKQLDADGKVEAALSAYQAVLEVDASNGEARSRIAELSKSTDATNTPPPVPVEADPDAEKKPGIKKKTDPKPEAEAVVEPKPEPKPEKDNPFLPTKKKNEGGPFLPTEK
jgi:eukaryotic-like serine/threonine-protein kinase